MTGFLLCWLLLLTGGFSPAAAQTRPAVRVPATDRPASILYVGNSFFYYNNSLHNHVGRLVAAGLPGHRLRSSSITISGSGFEWHDVDSYFRPGAVGAYTFDAANNIVFNDPKQKLFDLAILMDCSQCPLHPTLGATFREYARRHSETVRRHGAQPVFFMSWAYADAPEMTAQLAEAYTRAANDNGAYVIPAGLAFALAIARRPQVNLYVADKRHPSLAGTYLAAATTYAALFGRSPVGLAYTAGLDADTVAFLQNVAWDAVQAYLRP
ncbi:MAG: hypothetical protein JNM90_14980 [Burkholderiales bacterium]|nr:hypothetical protein [Burkholderiales bacterium]